MNPKYSKLLVFFILVIVLYKSVEYFVLDSAGGKSGQAVGLTTNPDKLKVSVYYEALCPDSKFFILFQLVPAYDELSDYLILDLVPYGKAKTIIEYDGRIEFRCQHDHVECFANKIHACAIKHVPEPDKVLKYIACMITDNVIPEYAGEKCGLEHNIDFAPIRKCATEQEGSLLLKKFGDRTHALNPKVKFIPTIELNDSQEYESQALILKRFQKIACKLLGNKPEKCSG